MEVKLKAKFKKGYVYLITKQVILTTDCWAMAIVDGLDFKKGDVEHFHFLDRDRIFDSQWRYIVASNDPKVMVNRLNEDTLLQLEDASLEWAYTILVNAYFKMNDDGTLYVDTNVVTEKKFREFYTEIIPSALFHVESKDLSDNGGKLEEEILIGFLHKYPQLLKHKPLFGWYDHLLKQGDMGRVKASMSHAYNILDKIHGSDYSTRLMDGLMELREARNQLDKYLKK